MGDVGGRRTGGWVHVDISVFQVWCLVECAGCVRFQGRLEGLCTHHPSTHTHTPSERESTEREKDREIKEREREKHLDSRVKPCWKEPLCLH